MNTFFKFAIGLLILCSLAHGQATLSSTTLSAALDNSAKDIWLTSTTGVVGPGIPEISGGIGTPAGNSWTVVYIDKEAMRVTAINSNGSVRVHRGDLGTAARSHASGATAYFGPPSYFRDFAPSGSCAAANLTVLPQIVAATGDAWTCPTSGPNSGLWTKSGTADTFTLTDGYIFIPGSACSSAVATTAYASGYPVNSTAAAGNPVYQVTTNNTAGTIEVTCPINLPARLTSGKGVTLTAAALHYGVQTTALSSIATATVKSVTYPTSTAAGAAAAGTVATAGGTLTVTPTSLQTATTTSGLCYSEKITFGTPISVNTANQQITVDQVFTTAGTTATTLQVCGVGVWFTRNPF